MATIDIGKLTFTHKGDYAGGTAYVLNDVVYYNGNSYVAKTSTTGNLPTSTAHWNNFAAGSGGIWNSGLSLGSANQILQVNSGASALEFTAKPEGKTLQVVRADATGNTTNGLTTSGMAGSSITNTGTAHITISFTPVSATSIVIVNAIAGCGQGGNDLALGALFKDSTCLSYTNSNGNSADASGMCLHGSYVSGGTSAQSIQFRAMGCWSGSTMNLGDLRSDSGATSPYGTMTIQEIQP